MSDDQIIFNSDQNDYNVGWSRPAKPKGLAGWLINHSAGLIKTERAANIALVFLSFVCLLASVIILINAFGGDSYY